MKGKCIIIIYFSVFLCLLAAFCGKEEHDSIRQHSISAEVISDGRTEEVKLWFGPKEMYYLFLPSYADLSQVQIRRHVSGPLYLDYKHVSGTMDCSEFPLNEPITLIHDPLFGYQWNELTILQSANVATMYIDVRSGTMDYIHAEKGNKESGTMRLYTPDGQLDAAAVVESLQGRGNSTWQWPEKKPYSLRLSEETNLLGMGEASRWILLAEAFDPSFLKNKIMYDLAGDAGMPYAPDCQWVDLYLNGEYAGLYLLSERNEIHPNRVNIPEASSFLVSWESEHRMIAQEYPYVKTERGNVIRVHQSALPLDEIQTMWQSVENAIFAENGIDPATGKQWQELIDMDSWAKLFLLDEISADYDGGKISKFFYYNAKDGNGKIYAGPVWDKDDSLATGYWAITPPNSIIASRSHVVNGMERRMFLGLFQKEEFRSRVIELYQSDFIPPLRELCDAGIDSYANRLDQAAQVNELRWKYGYTIEESRIIRDFLVERMDFFDAYWVRNEDFCHVTVYDTYEGSVGEFAVRVGDQIPAVPEYESGAELYGWYLLDSGEPFDITQPVWEDTDIVFRPA